MKAFIVVFSLVTLSGCVTARERCLAHHEYGTYGYEFCMDGYRRQQEAALQQLNQQMLTPSYQPPQHIYCRSSNYGGIVMTDCN